METKVKFLVIRFSSIGDIVLTSPVLRCLKNQIPGSEIHFLTKQKYAGVVKNNPYISQIHLFSGNLNETIAILKSENFDFIIDLHHNIRTNRIKAALGRVSFSFKKLNYQKWLMVHFKINKLPQVHIVDRYLDTLSLFDVKNDNLGLDYFISASDRNDVEPILKQINAEFIALCIGGQHQTKKMPSKHFASILKNIEYQCVFLGDINDKIVAEEIINLAGKPAMNLCGKLTINQSAAVISKAKLVVTHDSGLMHISAALKKNIISIWGNTIPEFGMYPYKSGDYSKIFEVKGLKCRPCSKLGYKKCPKKHFNCMEKQNIDEIINYIRFLYELK